MTLTMTPERHRLIVAEAVAAEHADDLHEAARDLASCLAHMEERLRTDAPHIAAGLAPHIAAYRAAESAATDAATERRAASDAWRESMRRAPAPAPALQEAS